MELISLERSNQAYYLLRSLLGFAVCFLICAGEIAHIGARTPLPQG